MNEYMWIDEGAGCCLLLLSLMTMEVKRGGTMER